MLENLAEVSSAWLLWRLELEFILVYLLRFLRAFLTALLFDLQRAWARTSTRGSVSRAYAHLASF